MTAQRIHRLRITEHLQVLNDAIAVGIEHRPATIGFHTLACAVDLLELYLHKTGRIPIGMQIKQDWFKEPKLEQKVLPLAQRHIKADFPHKEKILEEFYLLEEKRNKLIYGHSTLLEIKQMLESFENVKKILQEMLATEGENLEETDE